MVMQEIGIKVNYRMENSSGKDLKVQDWIWDKDQLQSRKFIRKRSQRNSAGKNLRKIQGKIGFGIKINYRVENSPGKDLREIQEKIGLRIKINYRIKNS